MRFRVAGRRVVTEGGWTTTNVVLCIRNPEDGRGFFTVSMWLASWWVKWHTWMFFGLCTHTLPQCGKQCSRINGHVLIEMLIWGVDAYTYSTVFAFGEFGQPKVAMQVMLHLTGCLGNTMSALRGSPVQKHPCHENVLQFEADLLSSWTNQCTVMAKWILYPFFSVRMTTNFVRRQPCKPCVHLIKE